MVYLLAITLGLGISYFLIFAILPLLIGVKSSKIGRKSFFSLFLIILLSLFSYVIYFSISNLELANRLLHIIGGGFLTSFVCFLAVRDSQILVNKFQFFILSALIVTALGVANEIVEFFLQNYMNFISATNINDTWLDLISNFLGILIASVIFVPFINCQKRFRIS